MLTILRIPSEWVKKNQSRYLAIIFEDEDIPNAVASNPHNWPTERLKLLAGIRNRSLEKAKEYQTDFYFVADCDNFILPHTLKTLIQKDKPFIAPMLRSIPKKMTLIQISSATLMTTVIGKQIPIIIKF